MQLSDFHFELPNEYIARYPTEKRSGSKLLNLSTGPLLHQSFSEVVDYIEPGDLLVFNDTKVIPARFYGLKKTGGRVEVFIERILDQRILIAQLRASKKFKIGDSIFCQGATFQVMDIQAQFYKLQLQENQSVYKVLQMIGEIPLPPYLGRPVEESDCQRYQTIYARHEGSVAAPTAGLHFDESIFAKLKKKNVGIGFLTLHIGAGTFQPVRTANIKDHKMHSEAFEVSTELVQQIRTTKAQGKRVIAVGTTSLRALESASQIELRACTTETQIFIYPGYQFRCVDALITNLHLPCSTLIMLVCALGGTERVMDAYREAVEQQYRFFSYGDAMFVNKIDP